jgi:transposase
VDSQSIKTTGVGGEERGYDGGKKVKGRKRHMLVDTEGFVLKVKVHSAKLMDYEGIKTLLQHAGEQFPRLSHLWLDGGYRGEDKGKDWVEKALEWSVELVERPRKPAPKEVLQVWAAELTKEDVKVDWQKLIPPQGFQALPRRWVVERSFAWICHNRRMSLGTTRGCVRPAKRSYMLP